jgi:hypothetical protein
LFVTDYGCRRKSLRSAAPEEFRTMILGSCKYGDNLQFLFLSRQLQGVLYLSTFSGIEFLRCWSAK